MKKKNLNQYKFEINSLGLKYEVYTLLYLIAEDINKNKDELSKDDIVELLKILLEAQKEKMSDEFDWAARQFKDSLFLH